MKKTLIIFLLSMLTMLTSCQRATQLTVINQSAVKIHHVIASSEGFSQKIKALQPNEQNQTVLTAPGTTFKLKLEFDADGKHIIATSPKAFSLSDQITATVAPDFTVAIIRTR